MEANPAEIFMPDFNFLAGQQTKCSLASNLCNKIFEMRVISPHKLIKDNSENMRMLISLLR